jgi:hypothetical protein
MGRELKREIAPARGLVIPDLSPPSQGAARIAVSPRDLPRWFTAVRGHADVLASRRSPLAVAMMALSLLALVGVALTRSVVLRALLPIVLALAAIVVVMRRRRAARPRRFRTPLRGLTLQGDRLSFHGSDHPAKTVISTSEPFGITLIATRRRDRLTLALSSSQGTLYVGAAFNAESRRIFSSLLARASTVGSEEVALDAVAPDGVPLTLPPEVLAALIDALARIDGGAQDRFVLSDVRGAPIVLDGQELRIREQRFDLSAPLEWRGIVFQETFGNVVAVYQGTWIHQGAAEIVLVSLLSSLGPPSAPSDVESAGVVELDRAALRDLRLMQATPDEPPPADRRVALDRVFMFPLRSALDRAPRPSSQPARASA